MTRSAVPDEASMVNPSMGLLVLGEVIVTPSPTPKVTGADATP